MNYFAHGIRFLDDPYFLAGTAIPDWLSVVDRRVRLRGPAVSPFLSHDDSLQSSVAAGILQHLHDDHWFHGTRAFAEVTDQLTLLFRSGLPRDEGFRPAFLGHIVTELLLDRELMLRYPAHIDRYYEVISRADPARVQSAVNTMSRVPTELLVRLIPAFVNERFLYDYASPDRLWFRLNQVMCRVKLEPLPESAVELLETAAEVVSRRWQELLPSGSFDW